MAASKRYFTPSEANATLPLVRSIVRDIIGTAGRLRERASVLITEGLYRPEEDPHCIAIAQNLQDLYAELEELGCDYKDWSYTQGLVDFPALIQGREVLLCWRSDEDAIRFYHGIHDGFAGRKPIPAELLDY